MQYTGRMVSVTIMLLAIVVARLYAYNYLNYPLTSPPLIGIGFLLVSFWAGKQYDKVRFYSEKDSLTGCYNRRFFSKRFPGLMTRLGRTNQNLSLVLLDCDNFKMINDTYGHKTGDQVLQEVSQLLLHSVRKSDMVVRWGGDEFLIVVPYADKEAVWRIIDRLESGLQELSQKMQIGVCLSSGVALYPQDGCDMDALLHTADSNMYLHKNKKTLAATKWSLSC